MSGYEVPIPEDVLTRLPGLITGVEGDVTRVTALESFPGDEPDDEPVLFGFSVIADPYNVKPKDGRTNKFRIGRETEFILTGEGRVIHEATHLRKIGQGHVDGLHTIDEDVYDLAKQEVTRKELERAGLIPTKEESK